MLLHGLTFNRSAWRTVLDELEAVDPDRRTVAFDLPDHGASAPLASHDLAVVAAAVHEAVEAIGLERPVLVGHSISGVIASIYAGLYPTAGVIAVDVSLRVRPFAEIVRSIEPALAVPATRRHGSSSRRRWSCRAWLRTREDIVRATARPRQDQFLSYQREILEVPLDHIEGRTEMLLAVLRATGHPYSVIAGDGFTLDDEHWLLERLPHTTVERWPGSGHFPFLAHPRRFAERLAATAGWPGLGAE